MSVRLEINPSGSALIAVINFNALELNGDRTEVDQTFRKTVYNTIAGRRIVGIRGPTTHRSQSQGNDAGGEFGDCNEGTSFEVSVDNALVRRMVIVGDTGGDDVARSATSCKCDTKIKSIEFNPVRIVTARR